MNLLSSRKNDQITNVIFIVLGWLQRTATLISYQMTFRTLLSDFVYGQIKASQHYYIRNEILKVMKLTFCCFFLFTIRSSHSWTTHFTMCHLKSFLNTFFLFSSESSLLRNQCAEKICDKLFAEYVVKFYCLKKKGKIPQVVVHVWCEWAV